MNKKVGYLGALAMAAAISAADYMPHGTPVVETPKRKLKPVKCPLPDQRNYAKGMKHNSFEFEFVWKGAKLFCICHVSGGTEKAMMKNAKRLNGMLEAWIRDYGLKAAIETNYFTIEDAQHGMD